MTLSTTNATGPGDAQVALDSAKTGAQKFFWITSLNRVVDDPIAIGIARIGRKAIRMRIAPCDRQDEQARTKSGGDELIHRRFGGPSSHPLDSRRFTTR